MILDSLPTTTHERPPRLSWFTKTSLLLSGSATDAAPVLARLREDEPVCWIPRFAAWVVTRHADVQELFADARLTADPRVYDRYRPPTVAGADRWLTALPFRATRSDPQSVSRRLAMAVLTPRAVARTEDRIRDVVDDYAKRLQGRTGVVDLMAEFTSPVSATAIGRVLGVPPKEADENRFRDLAKNATAGIRPFLSEAKRRRTELAAVEICEYVLELLERRRTEPEDDMMSDLLRVSSADTGSELENIVRIVSALVAAGTGTAGVACARGLRALMMQPAVLDELRADRSLLPGAIDELLRYDSGLTVMPRYVLEEFEFRGCRLKRGQLVALSILAANRDPRVFRDPDRLDLRRDCRPSLSFGHGPHYCTGTSVARVELRLMLAAALDFLPPRALLLDKSVRWSSRGLMGQIKSLPVDFRA